MGIPLSIATLIRRAVTRPAVNTPTQRPDIQGLRTFAVVAVILDHLLGWPNGGFVGVDIFFVISGFLITGLLLREQERTGTISFWGFYKRRAKRILPASLLVLVVTVAVSYFVFGWSRFVGVLWDGVAAALFAGNWRFASVGTDYFQADGPVSPLQHFWSLAVEEQFYFVWPWVMLAVFAVFARRNRKGAARTVAGVAITVISVASFAWALWESQNNNGVAYFSTLSRTWELGAGAMIAVAAPAFTRIPASARPILAWAGIAGMVAAVFVVESGGLFPAPAALLPVAAVSLVIIAGTGTSEHRFIFPLTNRVSSYIGDISFSLYLWHFPIIILGAAMVRGTGPAYYAVTAVVILLASVFAYHLWEDPIRRSDWLSGKKGWLRKVTFSKRYQHMALACLAVVTLAAAVPALAPRAAPQSALTAAATAPKTDAPVEAVPVVAYGPEVTTLQESVKQALGATSWPALEPSMDQAISTDPYPPRVGVCGSKEWGGFESCTFGPATATRSVVLLGDSVAMKWAGSLIPVAESQGWSLTIAAMFGCPLNDAKRSLAADKAEECATRSAEVKERFAAEQPDMVIIANTAVLPNAEGTTAPMGVASWGAGLQSALAGISGTAEKIILSAPPADIDVRDCYTPASLPADCVSKQTTTWRNVTAAERSVAETVGATYVDTSPLFCFEGLCPPFVENTATKRDLTHITLPYAVRVAPALSELISAGATP